MILCRYPTAVLAAIRILYSAMPAWYLGSGNNNFSLLARALLERIVYYEKTITLNGDDCCLAAHMYLAHNMPHSARQWFTNGARATTKPNLECIHRALDYLETDHTQGVVICNADWFQYVFDQSKTSMV
jgi:uncharacterized Zn finger protein